MATFDGSNPHALHPFRAIVDAPKITWPNGARVAVWVIPNVEHFHLELGPGAPDVRNYSRRDYGNRVGVWRLMDVMAKHGVRGTVALNGEVAKYYPRIMQAMKDLNWELMGHGLTNSRILAGMDLETERKTVFETRKLIEDWGLKMKGWLGPGLTQTWHTMDLLKEAGCTYVADWVSDDLPFRFNNGLYSINYSLELNDMPLFNNPSISIVDFERRIRDSFDTLYAEGAQNARVLGIALHPFLIGAAHRIKYLDSALSYIAAHDDVWFATGEEIIAAYSAQDPG